MASSLVFRNGNEKGEEGIGCFAIGGDNCSTGLDPAFSPGGNVYICRG